MKRPSDPGSSRPSDDESIAAMAAAWLAQRDDTLTSEEAAAFTQWRTADPRHETAVARLENTWAALQPLRDFRPFAARHPDRDLLATPARTRLFASPLRTAVLALAATIIFAIGWWTLPPSTPTGLSYATTAGGYERVMLADGSVLELNGDTAAVVNYTSTTRRVRLERGEAHFTVAKNPARPFWVEAGGVAVRAVGTAFNVRLGASDVEVLVTEGKVSVSNAVGPALAPAPLAAAEPPRSPDTFLTANERTIIPTGRATTSTLLVPSPAPRVEHITPEAVREALVWQGPRLVFADTPLAEVVAQFNRRNPIQIVLADPGLATLPVGGSFRPENVEAFVRLLESGGEVAVERSDASRLILSRVK
jgi:transmembrane sensor